jgi:hypothetical protein
VTPRTRARRFQVDRIKSIAYRAAIFAAFVLAIAAPTRW